MPELLQFGVCRYCLVFPSVNHNLREVIPKYHATKVFCCPNQRNWGVEAVQGLGHEGVGAEGLCLGDRFAFGMLRSWPYSWWHLRRSSSGKSTQVRNAVVDTKNPA